MTTINNNGNLLSTKTKGVSVLPCFATLRPIVIMNANSMCMNCGAETREVHHIDGDCDNNVLDNLMLLCSSCHREVHKIMGTYAHPSYPEKRKSKYIRISLYGNEYMQLKDKSIKWRSPYALLLYRIFYTKITPSTNITPAVGEKTFHRIGFNVSQWDEINLLADSANMALKDYLRQCVITCVTSTIDYPY